MASRFFDKTGDRLRGMMAGGSSYNSVSANGSSRLHAGDNYSVQQPSHSAPQQTYSVPQQYHNPPQQSGNAASPNSNPSPQAYSAIQNNYNVPQQDCEAPQHNYNAPQHNGQIYNAPQHTGNVYHGSQHTGNVYHGPQHTGNIYNNTSTNHYMQDLDNPLVAVMSSQAGKKSTELHKACARGDENQVRSLLEAGEKIEAQDADFMTPLQVAVKRNKLNIASLLVNKEANVDAECKMWAASQPSIFLAIKNKNEAMAQMLVENGADIEANSTSACGLTPLGVAAKDGLENTVSLLLEKGADTEAADTFGATPLYWATMSGYEAIMIKLLQSGASPDFKVRDAWEMRMKRILQSKPHLARVLQQAQC